VLVTADALPGVRLVVVPPPPEQDALRTDVAVLLGRARRGPLGVPVRVESWPEFRRWFGPADGAAATPFAARGFFENGGRTAWILRVGGPGRAASTVWTLGAPTPSGLRPRYQVIATSPGSWADHTRVQIRYQASSVAGSPSMRVRIIAPEEPVESFASIRPEELTERLSASRLVRFLPLDPGVLGVPGEPGARRRDEPAGSLVRTWELVLGQPAVGSAEDPTQYRGVDDPPDAADYRQAVEAMANLAEPALVAVPDLLDDLPEPIRDDALADLLSTVSALQDRLLVLDLPRDVPTGTAAAGQVAVRALGPEPSGPSAEAAARWVSELRLGTAEPLRQCAAVYHPRLQIRRTPDGPDDALRTVPAAGHVMGVIARMDAERGPHHTPANAVLLEAVDIDPRFPTPQQAILFEEGVNLLRCVPGLGLRVWGGRTLAEAGGGRYIAHRRLVHLLERTIRGVAGPLVFEINGPQLRLALVRGVTSLLLQSFRSGALAGSRPEDAFRVTCDERNNPPEQPPDLVVCDVDVAPAAPMEFITIRLVLGQDRGLEVLES
jgi:hypothetical protein